MSPLTRFLKETSLFLNLSEEEIKKIERICKEKKYADGEVIFYEGSLGKECFIVLEGNVEILKNFQKANQDSLAVFSPGKMFGEIALIDDLSRSATSISKGHTKLLAITRDDFKKIISANTSIASSVMKSFASIIRKTNENYIEGLRLKNQKLQGETKVRKKAQKELHLANQILEQRVKARTADIEKANDQLTKEIEEHKKTLKELRESRELIRLTLENAPVGISTADIDGKFRGMNQEFCDMTGYSQDELLSMTLQDIIHTDFLSKTNETLKDFMNGKIERLEIELCLIRKDEVVIEVVNRGDIVRDTDGRPVLIVYITEDVTEKKKLEQQLIHGQKMEAIGTLAGGIAHDFNNILGAIISYTEMAHYDAKAGSTERYIMEQVLKASHRAKNLIQQILAFSRSQETHNEQIKLTDIVKEAVKLLRASLPTTVEIKQCLNADKDTIFANSTQVHQIIMNLCTNAGQAMSGNDHILELSLSNVHLEPTGGIIHYSESKKGPYIKLSVKDTGHGIDPSINKRIFDPYFTTKQKAKGTGMGLSVVHGIVKNIGGNIRVHSQKGIGTTFDVFFPLSDGASTIETARLGSLPTGNERILFIDDEDSLVEAGKSLLERLGYQVEGSTNPIDGLKKFKSHPNGFDLVITDMTMPKMTGDKLSAELLDIRSDIAIILCTGYSNQITEKKAFDIGIRGFLMKPFSIQDLSKIIRKVLD